MTKPTREMLLELFSYDPATGELRRLIGSTRSHQGDVPGYINTDGRRRIRVGGTKYQATSLIWVMMTGEWPSVLIDHIDTYGPKADWGDRWDNLRLATQAENGRNRRVGRNNKSGRPGIFHFQSKCWRAQITHHQHVYWLGDFKERKEAVAAREAAEIEFFGKFRPAFLVTGLEE